MNSKGKETGSTRSVTKPSGTPTPKHKRATELQIRETIAMVRDALDQGKPERPNIWVFYSNKNEQLLTIEGDLYFILCVLLEGDSTALSYSFEPFSNFARAPLVLVTRTNSVREAYSCSSSKECVPERSYSSVTSNPDFDQNLMPITLTERDLAKRMVEFANWLMLSGAMTRARSFSAAIEVDAMLTAINRRGAITFRDAMILPGIDPALMLGSIAKGLASGVLVSDTSSTLLNIDSVIHMSTARHPSATRPFKLAEGTGQSDPRAIPLCMPRNRRTLGYPELMASPHLWLKDEIPDVVECVEQRRRAKAVQLYLYNRSYSEIQQETGFSGSWVRKLFRRTLQIGSSGSPVGLAGLVRYRHSQPYKRQSDLPKSNMEEGRKGGYAGAFERLAAQYPKQFFEMLEAEVLRKRGDPETGKPCIREARVSWVDLHGRMKAFLRSMGVGDNEYPFNTRDVAYSSLVTLCNSILFNRPIQWIESRGGKDAVRRARIGSGKSSLISAQWLNQIATLDYQKCDSASIVEIQPPKGPTIDVPTARWWAGAIVETFSEAIIATSDSFETQTTEDCLMELVDAGISVPDPLARLSRLKNCPDGTWLPAQMMKEYAGQAWDILKLDRAWAHKSTTALSAIIATVGCALCYGSPGAWYARDLVERTFEKLTQAGPQGLPSTLGTGPNDVRKDEPDAQALRFRIMQDDVCDLIKDCARWINETRDEGVFWASPLATLKAAMSAETGKFFPRPLPRARNEDRPLMWHTIPCTVEGNATKGVSPNVRVHRTRFRGPELKKAWHLVGRGVYLQVFRRDIRKARVLLATTGELVGYVRPDDKWMGVAVSWRDHALIQKFGQIEKRHERTPAPVHNFLAVKQEELVLHKTKITQTKRDATAIARIKRNAQRHAGPTKPADPKPVAQVSAEYTNVLGPAPALGAMRRVGRRG